MSKWSAYRKESRLGARGIVVGLAVLALLALDVVLVYLALRSVEPNAEAQGAAWVGSPEESEVAEEGLSEESEDTAPEAPASPENVQAGGDDQRLLAAMDGSVAWRAERGTCQSPGTLEVSGDSGQTWWDITPAGESAGAVLQLNARDPSSASAVIATGEDCEIQTLTTSDWGTTWSPGEFEASSAFWGPGSPGRLHQGGEVIDTPCADPVDVTSSGDLVAVLCADGVLRVSPESGTGWDTAEVSGAAAIAASQGEVLVAGQMEGCDGVGLSTVQRDSGRQEDCVTGLSAEDITVEVANSTTWVWAGDSVAVSSGEGWTVSP